MLGKRRFRNVIPSEAEGSFWRTGIAPYVWIAEKGNPSAKEARKSRVQGRFLATLEMTVWGNGFISRSVQRICWENATSATSSRAKPRDLFGTLV